MTKDKYQKKIKLVIFDLDETLVHHKMDGVYMYKYVEPVLKYLKSNNIRITLASYNTIASSVLNNFKIKHYFELIETECWIYGCDYKEYMLKKIISTTRVDTDKILFIDDNQQMINTGEKLGIQTELILDGNIKKCLEKYFDIDNLEI